MHYGNSAFNEFWTKRSTITVDRDLIAPRRSVLSVSTLFAIPSASVGVIQYTNMPLSNKHRF